jgi:3-phenylpropionate/trans-cinnamate dioxygenase ferredoxin reductase subunit
MSSEFRFLVLGGGAAGFSAADAYREAGGEGPVAIVTDEGRMPYNRPPLTKELLRGESSEDELPLADEGWLTERGVALITGHAMTIDLGERRVALSGGRELSFGSCLLATGAEPTRLPVPGADDPAVRAVRKLDDMRELLRRLGDGDPVVVIGSGFIGCEIAASLRLRGHPVQLVSDEAAPNEARLGTEAAGEISGWLREDGVELRLGTEVERIDRTDGGFEVVAGEGRVHGATVVMATGVTPRSELAAACGIALRDGAVPVDSAMRTAHRALLAAGDVCLAHNDAAGRPLRVEHWGDALGQGEIAGQTAAGVSASWSAVPGFWSTIGRRTLKYAAWGDGFDGVRVERGDGGAFTAWYGKAGTLVGVLTHETDENYERGRKLIEEGAPWSF